MKYFILTFAFFLLPYSYGNTLNFLNSIPKEYQESTVLAGGCFWGMEDILRKIPGVVSTEVGYAGGSTKNPTYADVKTGNSGHAEAVKVDFDKRKVSFDILLDYFFRMHDPTTLNQQGNDKSTQYRSAIFYMNEEQRKTALKVIKETKRWERPIITQVVPLNGFYRAEDYHQDYLLKNPKGYTCHWLRK